MATKIKRLYKKFKNISRIFAVKEKKMEIGYPTDVKHVTHIGWDTPSHSTAPSSVYILYYVICFKVLKDLELVWGKVFKLRMNSILGVLILLLFQHGPLK
ncbi:hypothetical protein Godav_028987, partial [Gossypium davidsonii]|nr:hypothetical protein [Gossypium davidsonii]